MPNVDDDANDRKKQLQVLEIYVDGKLFEFDEDNFFALLQLFNIVLQFTLLWDYETVPRVTRDITSLSCGNVCDSLQ